MLRIQMPSEVVGDGPSERSAPLECQLFSVAERIRACTEHQWAVAAVLNGIRRDGLTEPPPAEAVEAAVAVAVKEQAAPVAVLDRPLAHGTGPSDHPAADGWVAIDVLQIHDLQVVIGSPVEAMAPLVLTETFPCQADRPASAFDELFTAVSAVHPGMSEPIGPLPPRSRFMLRVAPVKKPHRSTRRNYDYFEDLNRSLQMLADSGSGDPPA